MRTTTIVAALATVSNAIPSVHMHRQANNDTYFSKPLVNSIALQDDISQSALLDSSQILESFAYAYPERNRLIGTGGHNDTVVWLKEELEATEYYNVSLQPFSTVVMLNGTINEFSVDGTATDALLFDYSPSGNVTAPLAVVNNLGCVAGDFPTDVLGKIALISRGTCEFGLKSALANAAGAVGALIYNNIPGAALQGTLGAPPRPEGDYVVSLSLTLEQGTALVQAIATQGTVTATLDVTTVIETIHTNNVLATSKHGDQNNKLALGAHTDSVIAGPGINDDGSGTVGILEVAKALSKYQINNAVTFGFWAGEEEGLLGSTYYVENLPASEAAQIRAYLNFDMIASPNYVHAIYDGDGSAFNLTGPAGSAELETFFEEYFTGAGENFTATAFDGRSDYGPFLDAGIPSGGTFTGAEENKTAEEAIWFGGVAGVALDHCYHQACDNVTNLNMGAFELHAKGIAAAVGTYSSDWGSFPTRNATIAKRSMSRSWKDSVARHHRSRRSRRLAR